jgi:hypothetical protein
MDGLEQIIKDSEKRSPEVSEQVIDQQDPETATDKSGVAFDPLFHAKNKEGSPVITQAGYFRKKSGPKQPWKNKPQGEETQEVQAERNGEGIVAAEMTFLIANVVFGEAGSPTDDERKNISNAYSVYFEAKGIKDLPPGWMLATVLTAYAAPRVSQPETKSRLKRFYEKVKGFMSRLNKNRVEDHV